MTEALQTISEIHRDMWRLSTALSDLSQRLQIPVAQPHIELMGAILDCLGQHIEQTHQPKARAHLYRTLRLRSTQASELIDEFEREHAAARTNGANCASDLMVLPRPIRPRWARFAPHWHRLPSLSNSALCASKVCFCRLRAMR